jgi:hypothetical protein
MAMLAGTLPADHSGNLAGTDSLRQETLAHRGWQGVSSEDAMGQMWIDDHATLGAVAPALLKQEARIAQQRQLIDQLDASGHRDLANDARQFLGDLCGSLETMRRDERAAKIESREKSFRSLSEAESVEQVMRDRPL